VAQPTSDRRRRTPTRRPAPVGAARWPPQPVAPCRRPGTVL